MAELTTLYSDHRALQQQFADVSERRAAANSQFNIRLEQLTKEWQSEHSELLAEYQEISLAASEKEGELRASVIEAYAADPSKKTVAPGLSVRVAKKPVYDAEKALQWAMHHKLALALDKKAFEKIADSATDIDFVTYDESVTAVISK